MQGRLLPRGSGCHPGEGQAVARRGKRRVSQSGALPTGLADEAGHEGISPDPEAGAEHQEDGGAPHETGRGRAWEGASNRVFVLDELSVGGLLGIYTF